MRKQKSEAPSARLWCSPTFSQQSLVFRIQFFKFNISFVLKNGIPWSPKIVQHPYKKDPTRDHNLENYPYGRRPQIRGPRWWSSYIKDDTFGTHRVQIISVTTTLTEGSRVSVYLPLTTTHPWTLSPKPMHNPKPLNTKPEKMRASRLRTQWECEGTPQSPSPKDLTEYCSE